MLCTEEIFSACLEKFTTEFYEQELWQGGIVWNRTIL